jgi:hypothetical protein
MIEIQCQRQAWRNGVELMILDRSFGHLAIAEPLTLRTISDGEFFGQPTLTLENAQAQQLIDELWRCGLRPSEGTGSAGSLAATERHLKDMQSIALGLLKKDGAL